MLQILLAYGGSPNQSVGVAARSHHVWIGSSFQSHQVRSVTCATNLHVCDMFLCTLFCGKLQDGSARVAALLLQTMWRQWLRLKAYVVPNFLRMSATV